MHKRITVKDIAKQAGVSIGTVDRVLHNRGEVSEGTRKKIMDLVEKLNYTPNFVAKSLSLKKGFNIALLLPEGGTVNPYWKKPLEGIQNALEELKDYNTDIRLFYFDTGQEKSFEEQFDSMLLIKPDGIIFAPHFPESSLKKIKICEKLKIPYLLIDTYLESESSLAFIGQNAFQSGQVAAKLMHYGLQSNARIIILHLGRNKAITPHMKQREQGFLSYFKTQATGINLRIVTHTLDLAFQDGSEEDFKEFYNSFSNTGGIFVTNSRAYKVANYLENIGSSDTLLVGYDLIDENLEFVEKGIIDFLICQKPEQQGYKSTMAMFDYLLTGKRPEKVNFSPIDIVIRENYQSYINTNHNNI